MDYGILIFYISSVPNHSNSDLPRTIKVKMNALSTSRLKLETCLRNHPLLPFGQHHLHPDIPLLAIRSVKATMSLSSSDNQSFKTNDGVVLRYLDTGAGGSAKPLLILVGCVSSAVRGILEGTPLVRLELQIRGNPGIYCSESLTGPF